MQVIFFTGVSELQLYVRCFTGAVTVVASLPEHMRNERKRVEEQAPGGQHGEAVNDYRV